MELTQIDESKLAAVLQEWFNQNNPKILLNKNFWSRNPVGKAIKDNLNKCGKWRAKARGNPRKGYLNMLKKKQEREDW